MDLRRSPLFVLLLATTISGYGDDRFVKKYAMMKVYESCLGPAVVREVRQEMRAASAKCATASAAEAAHNRHQIQLQQQHHHHNAPPPPVAPPPAGNDLGDLQAAAATGDYHPPPPLPPPRHSARPAGVAGSATAAGAATSAPAAGTLDSARLQQAILSILNRQAQPASSPSIPVPSTSHYRPTPPVSLPPSLSDFLQQMQPTNNYFPQSAASPQATQPNYDALQNLQQLQSLQGLQALQNLQQGGGGGLQDLQRYQHGLQNLQGLQGLQGLQSLYQSTKPSLYQQPSFYQPQQSFYNDRSRYSRDLDVQGQLETLTSRMTGRVRNVTCVMQELGYLDSNLEPDFDRISERIGRLPVAMELRRDMLDGLNFCRQFSQCIPETRRDKFLLSGELLKPMFFFRCYKHKKLEACIMKDVRERYMSSEAELMPSPEMRSMHRSRTGTRGKNNKNSPHPSTVNLADDHMASAVYEFLYGGDELDADSMF